MYKKGDFHIHSTSSDGGYTPKQVVNFAKKRGVDIISLTDHNNTCGIDESILEGERIGVKVIPGVELSTKHKNGSRVHILGYFKDESYKDELLVKILKDVKNHKISNIKKILGRNVEIDKGGRLSVDNGIRILKFFGATVILAHPVLLNRNDFIEIIELDFDGLEAKYFSNSEEDTKYFLKVAKNNNLLYTAGSDFHNYKKNYREHGLIGDVYLNENEIYNFLTKGGLYPYI
ncbi:PHP domain-containing protein [Clostridium botulinum]|uniref:PHP domain-containing protein n=1 Tax=Clostridium botulinum TaxID=1491 RepID=UPI0019671214|nr:PHP domain-containing protein [Clostridium botulinum]MBN1074584.1 PHP domain-containing protein [Clostridium botulinum]